MRDPIQRFQQLSIEEDIRSGRMLSSLIQARSLTVGTLFRQQARYQGTRIAVDDGLRTWTFHELNDRVNRLSFVLHHLRIARGDRVAIVSENRREYIELYLAAAKIGAIVACQNWRQSDIELQYSIELCKPELIIVSERFSNRLAGLNAGSVKHLTLGDEYERLILGASADEPNQAAEPEDGLVILYTSGTTGAPKGAVISHRAMIARSMISRIDGALFPERAYPCWSPMFHMASCDNVFGLLMTGGKIIIMDGFKAPELAEIIVREEIGVLTLMPGMIDTLAKEFSNSGRRPKGIKAFGSLADLVPRHQLAEITTLFGAPYRNTFGSTETGLPPASRGLVPIGVVPERLSKEQSSYCEVRLVDEEDNEVPDGERGEVCVRGPSLFSSYWGAPEETAKEFRGGWFHMGDVLVRNLDGTLDFVDRRKYMIKSGGENIYPAEIEQILLSSNRVTDAVVIRRQDDKWGEVPVAFVARSDESLTAKDVLEMCRGKIANYKVPKDVVFITVDEFPRTLTGKIMRHVLEARINSLSLPADASERA
jgi:acyl-CoA synthetase (AMP-forming)/AMP-acid ligase II